MRKLRLWVNDTAKVAQPGRGAVCQPTAPHGDALPATPDGPVPLVLPEVTCLEWRLWMPALGWLAARRCWAHRQGWKEHRPQGGKTVAPALLCPAAPAPSPCDLFPHLWNELHLHPQTRRARVGCGSQLGLEVCLEVCRRARESSGVCGARAGRPPLRGPSRQTNTYESGVGEDVSLLRNIPTDF